ncbi:MarR family winged helix-turn-helix transcriptional regulator [Granulicoccus sp. GXG6511]|uniref:MarR family winged helix-turn-helix transcriptional regulator n=1 Tax=Granulicoccus sp. GXG6511 TaxID=3381351 RepID=UPI003D7CAE38
MGDEENLPNTVAMLGQAYSLLGFKIVDGVVGAGYPQKPKHSAVFAQIRPEGSRVTDLARGANMTPQAMGELVDELVELGYVVRTRDPDDGRAKLVTLTARGQDSVRAGMATIQGIEDQLDALLGPEGRQALRRLLATILTAVPD